MKILSAFDVGRSMFDVGRSSFYFRNKELSMKKRIRWPVWLVILAIAAGPALAQEPIIYPKKGQSSQQLEKDKYDCYQWAKKETGFDPQAPATASTPPPVKETTKAGAGRGAVGGGLIGLGVGAIAGAPGKGAAIGAASGALIGGVRRKKHTEKQEEKEQQWTQQEAASRQQKQNYYNRAFSACMEARDYNVK
jgi:outer membrane lipoprotein SlyB